MNTLHADNTNRRAIPWRGALMMALGYAVFYVGLAYFIDHPFSLHWLLWPALAVVCITGAADWKGVGDRPWFIRTLTGVIVAVAITGAIMS
ncbi:hypothetical protein [Streptomyces sp. NPDC006879]|uniref:hypothetical protein n=1 Tax=Streptomyces sp. NPDC006879 TaxID=3364767 RepID=UPI0036D109C6